MALDPLGYDEVPDTHPIEQLPDIDMVAAASLANAEALRDARVTPARACHDANECMLAFSGLPNEATADPRYLPAQCLNFAVARWVTRHGTQVGDLWGDVARAFIVLLREISRRERGR